MNSVKFAFADSLFGYRFDMFTSESLCVFGLELCCDFGLAEYAERSGF